jgi:hypothetical protein
MQNGHCPGSRCQTPHFPFNPVPLPPSVVVSRELGDAGCRAIVPRPADDLHDFVTAPTDARGVEGGFRC